MKLQEVVSKPTHSASSFMSGRSKPSINQSVMPSGTMLLIQRWRGRGRGTDLPLDLPEVGKGVMLYVYFSLSSASWGKGNTAMEYTS